MRTTPAKKIVLSFGRYEPYHNGHDAGSYLAYQTADQVVRIIGSVHKPRTIENPFDFKERELLIRAPLTKEQNDRTWVYGVEDTLYNDNQWLKKIQSIVKRHTLPGDGVHIVGGQKGEWYMKFFPEPAYKRLLMPEVLDINATQIRGWYFGLPWCNGPEKTRDYSRSYGTWTDLGFTCAQEVISKQVPESTLHYLDMFRKMPYFDYLCKEYAYYRKYWKDNDSYRYGADALNFNTTDAVVVQSGHVLMVQRKEYPGKGLWALPGGFLNANEEIEDGMIRELKEETHLKVAEKILRGNIVGRHHFSAPKRSLRGRIITFAYFIQLPAESQLPKVKGGDDAAKAKWVPLSEVGEMRPQMFEDHLDIIEHFVGELSSRPIIIGDNPEMVVGGNSR